MAEQSTVLVKICGLTRVEDARMAERFGADYVGAVLSEGFGRSVVPELARGFAGHVPLVGVLVDEPATRAEELARRAGADILQLHGSESPQLVAELRRRGAWKLWKAVRVGSADDVTDALERFAGVADGLLLEGAHAGKGGGVGAGFSWSSVAPVRDQAPEGLLWVVAGGLRPENVAEAVEALRPHVVDVSSGVERGPGVKDADAVRAFVERAKAASGGTRGGRSEEWKP